MLSPPGGRGIRRFDNHGVGNRVSWRRGNRVSDDSQVKPTTRCACGRTLPTVTRVSSGSMTTTRSPSGDYRDQR